jgi:hypothetical protein
MIDCLIFSKDRACQLDLLLRSINDNFSDLSPFVLYKSSSPAFQKGYTKLIKAYPKVNFVTENNFMGDVKTIVDSFTNKRSLCLVDDSVIINQFEPNTLSILNDASVHAISLRLHPNISYTYPTNITASPVKLTQLNVAGEKIYRWEWKQQKDSTDFSYPSCIDGHIYNTTFFKFIIAGLTFTNPNSLEEQLNNNRKMFKPCLACYEHSICLTIPNNLSQNHILTNRKGDNKEYSLESLNKKFLDGLIISTENIYGFKNKAAHEEIGYILK